jgi:hypothetical protein
MAFAHQFGPSTRHHKPEHPVTVEDRPSIICTITGPDTAAACGLAARAAAPVLALCRFLVEAGYDPGERLEAYRGSTLCLTVSSIGEGARLAVRDNKWGSPRLRKIAKPSMAAASSMRSREEAATSIGGA